MDPEGLDLDIADVVVTANNEPVDPGLFSVDAAAGTVTLLGGQFENLAQDEELALSIAFNVTDGVNTVAGNAATITITGENDAPMR